uniref:Helix-turn-helix protein n=1 Tax=Siphoviridae sp. ctZiV25 TaxID=2825560 RepID=A0A8S5TXT8_9CAUD|nr:MAG TPA: helix-turn-helix protein [Siphoviridae sp. ctZiV25]
MTTLFFNFISKLEHIKYPYYCGLQERRQFVCFLFTTFVELFYIPANILGLNDYHHSIIFDTYNWLHLIFVIILQILFWTDTLSTKASVYIFFIAVTVKLSAESLYELFTTDTYGIHILGNLSIILILASVAIAIRLSKLAVTITTILTLSLIIFCITSPIHHIVRVMRVFFVGYMFILYIITFDSKNATKGLRLSGNITKEEQVAIDMLINLNKSDKEKVYSLLSRLSSTHQEELLNNIKDYYHQQYIETLNLLSTCPSLTPSEIEICKLILMDKSLKEICSTLHKTPSNITSQRTHIRKKLNLTKQDDLRTSLMILINKTKGTTERT